MTWKIALVGFCVAASACSAYEGRVSQAVERLRTLHEVGSDHVGYAGTPHAFYLLFSELQHACTNKDVTDMVHDANPIVRIMGAKCVVDGPWRKIDKAVLNPLVSDKTEILVGPGGCVFRHMTVGAVVLALVRDPGFLGVRETKVKPAGIPAAWADWRETE
ncbi:hypothetical protein GALL_199710 [mine drainage metagenome]|uniref:Uncharacterized protein n=1 Tax=mine drainage metagenome TaxID=410659 RepID=A0A1J5RR00_9ZZZZ